MFARVLTRSIVAVALAILALVGANATAVQTTWIGAEGTNWSLDGNWDNHEPISSVDAYLNNGNTCVVNQAGEACKYLKLGSDAGATGKVTMESGTLATYSVSVGTRGSGALAIRGGGQVSSIGGSLGDFSGSTGTVTVDGANSKWTSSEADLYVGESGSGTLTITNGGEVSSTWSSVGNAAGCTGLVMVERANSKWTNSSLTVGNYGSGALAITSGAQVSSSWRGTIGYQSGSTGLVTVDGANSKWTDSDDLTIGTWGSGTLTITGGASVSNTYCILGAAVGSTGSVAVDGANSKWDNSSALYVGDRGSGTLTVTNGGEVSSTYSSSVGNAAGSTGSVTVDGVNSKWSSSSGSSGLYVGDSGSGTLTVKNGGQVFNSNTYLGWNSGSIGIVTVDGTNSRCTNSSLLMVGRSGAGTLMITGAGHVSSITANVGYDAGSTGTVTVQGANSEWTNSLDAGLLSPTTVGVACPVEPTSDLYVAYYGSGTLTIKDGGHVLTDVPPR